MKNGKNGKAKATKIPQSYDELFPGRFLKGELFKGKAGMLTIQKIWRERMDDDEWAVIASFEETNLHLAVNKTNAECLKGMWGKKISDWLGKRVTFYPKKIKAFGQLREAIRIMGSPDIAGDMNIMVEAGQASGPKTMKKTPAKKWADIAATDSVEDYDEFGPDSETDPETGEVPLSEEEKAEIKAAESGLGAA